MTPTMKREYERRTVEEIDTVIREGLEELRATLRKRHQDDWQFHGYRRIVVCGAVKRMCRILRTQMWIQRMTLRGHANFLGLTR